MPGTPPKNAVKKSEKIFENAGKPHGSGISYLYILDILIQVWVQQLPPVTIAELRDTIAAREGVYYSNQAIRQAISSIHVYCSNIELYITQVTAGRSRAKAFSIQFKSENTCSQTS